MEPALETTRVLCYTSQKNGITVMVGNDYSQNHGHNQDLD